MLDLDNRIAYYIGTDKTYDSPPIVIDPVRHDAPFSTKQDYNKLKTGYLFDIQRYQAYSKKLLWFQCGDAPYIGPHYPVLVKIRRIDHPESKGVIANLNSARHWGNIQYLQQNDISWGLKTKTPVWRGSTTGCSKNNYQHYNREDFVKLYFLKYNVGFSNITQSCNHLRSLTKNQMSIKELLTHKYIVSLEGNDKSSSLNWILASNSVPIMAKPKCHSWLCEPWLEPNVHYVEIKEDFSDLPEKIEWCISNDNLCKEIAQNGRDFIIKNFEKQDLNQTIERCIIDTINKQML
jgi:hypothetical protein